MNLYKYFNKISASNDLSLLSAYWEIFFISSSSSPAVCVFVFYFIFFCLFVCSVSLSFCSINAFFTLMKIRIDRYDLLSCVCAFVWFIWLAFRSHLFDESSTISQCAFVAVFFIINRLAMSCLVLSWEKSIFTLTISWFILLFVVLCLCFFFFKK